MRPEALTQAVDAALAGDWHGAHGMVQQDERRTMACWIHAVLHKIEGDGWTSPQGAGLHEVLVPSIARDAAKQHNSRYWYARTGHRYEEWNDAQAELKTIRAQLEAQCD